MEWDAFISHASEDKPFVRTLAEALQRVGLRVWYDEFTLCVGDSLRRSIDYGLANSRYGIVILSPNFFAKDWPQKELDGLIARETLVEKVILPVWHNITANQVKKYSPILADRFAVSSGRGPTHVASELLRTISAAPHFKPQPEHRSHAQWETESIERSTDEMTKHFESPISQPGRRLIVTRPHVRVTCDLPLAFGESSGLIEFSDAVCHGLAIQLTHRDILGPLMIGLHTPLRWLARPFLKQIDDDVFQVNLGQTVINLSEAESNDLCDCIDGVCGNYKQAIIEAEHRLETWDYEPMQVEDISGFCLLRVRQELWELMHNFSYVFDYAKGDTKWHTFHHQNISIRVGRGVVDHAFITPKTDINPWSFLPTGYIFLLYEVPEFHLKWAAKGETPWQQIVGKRGMWTAHQTKKWMKEEFIPKVLEHYWKHGVQENNLEVGQSQAILDRLIRFLGHEASQKEVWDSLHERIAILSRDIDDCQIQRIPFLEINEPQHMGAYLRDVQAWLLYCSGRKIPIALMLPYYEAFTDLLRSTDPSTINYDYVGGKLGAVDSRFDKEQDRDRPGNYYYKKTRDEVINSLDQHIFRIRDVGYDDSDNADLISRVFISIVEEGTINFSQIQINKAKDALEPLWNESRFEMHHVVPNYLRS
jgi:hypothetical protein